MKSKFALASLAALLLALAVAVRVANASGPIAVYALIDKVTLQPNDDQPQRILISGVFSVTGNALNVYLDPQRGYLCYSLPPAGRMPNASMSNPQDPQLALREWSDLKSVAGTRQVVAFGSSWIAKPRVRTSSAEALNDPDPYTFNIGVRKLNADLPQAKALLDFEGH